MSAFRGLIVTNHNRAKRKNTVSANPKSPIDPLDDLAIGDDEDCHSELTDEHVSLVPEEPTQGLYESLQRNWSPGDFGHWEQACFAALCCIFYDPTSPDIPTPHRVVVTGLWGNVVLPSLLGADSDQIPELVAQEIWDSLHTKLQYISEDEGNGITINHTIYSDYGQTLADNTDKLKWKHGFARFLHKSLDGDQLHFVQLYAVQVVVPYWLSLEEVTHAASLLHQPSFISKEWTMLSKLENLLQVTLRHVKQVELYLGQLPPESTKWQEALGLYQGWHCILQQQRHVILGYAIDHSSDQSHGSGSSKSTSMRSKRSRIRRSIGNQPRGDPMQTLILGKSLVVLSLSLDSILTDGPGEDPALNVLWRRQAEYLAEGIQILSYVDDSQELAIHMAGMKNLLGVAAWLSMSSSCAIAEEYNAGDFVDINALAQLYDLGDIEKGEANEVQCLNVARALLNSIDPSRKSKTLKLSYLTLHAELQDAWGRWLYNKQRYEQARFPLEDATKLRRQVLALLKDTQPDSTSLFWWGSAPLRDGEDETEDMCRQLHLNIDDIEIQVHETEITLSQSLEYAALALHACDVSMAAMSWLQEAVALKAAHFGKMSLEVARLNAAMAVVNEDLLQWEASLSRYRECLRIRMHVLSQKDPDEWFTTEHDLFRTILENLASMGNVYRMLGDHDNAVGCYWKIATMSKKEWEGFNRATGDAGFWGFDAHRKMAADSRPILLPSLVLDEERYSKSPLEVSPPQSPPLTPTIVISEAEKSILFQAAQAYQSIISLFEDKANRVSPSSSLASSVAEEDVPLLLASSFRLGMIHIYFGNFRSAMSSFEHSLHSLWVLDPGSSDSSSEDEDRNEYSREEKQRRRVLKGLFSTEMQIVDDESVYHAIGICRGRCGEHDQAIRFHLTALKNVRRRSGVDSVQASEILYDAATSYWYLKDYDKAEEFWSGCLRIRSSKEAYNLNESFGDLLNEREWDPTSFSDSIEHARILYNVGASMCALGKYTDARTQESLEKAVNIFANCFDSDVQVEIASCWFYLSVIQLRKGSSGDVTLLNTASEYLNRASTIYRSLGYLRSSNESGLSQEPAHLSSPLQAHCRYVEANILESLGKLHLAMDTYAAALLIYRALEDKRWNIYVASILNNIAKLQVLGMYHENVILANFEEALILRRECLGCDHSSVGDTLYQMAGIHSRIGEIATALDMYHEALRIQMVAEGKETSAVAMTLQMIASIYVKKGNFDVAMEKLDAALEIRKNRTALLNRASRAISFWSGDLADDYLALSEESSRHMDDGHFRKALQDDSIKEEVGLSVVLHCMGNVHVKLGEYGLARERFEESLRVRTRHPVYQAMSPDGVMTLHVWDTLHNLGSLYELQKDYKNALRYYSTTLKLKHDVLSCLEDPRLPHSSDDRICASIGTEFLDERYLNSKGSVSYAMTLHRLGTVQYRLGDRNAAILCLSAALRIQKHFLGPHHFTVAKTLVDLACVLRNTDGKTDAARTCYQEAYEIRRLRYRGEADVGHVLYHIGQLYDMDNDYTRATCFYYRAIQTYGRQYVNAASRRFCEYLFSKGITPHDDHRTPEDLLAKEGLQILSIEESDDMIRSHFATISKALRVNAKHRMANMDNSIMMDLDVNAPDCWISFELYLLSLFELVHYLSMRWAKEVRLSTSYALRQLENAGNDGMKTSQDAITFQMLCLIQE